MNISLQCQTVMARNNKKTEQKILDLKDISSHLLDEIRIVLPGTEVLLGFQLSTIFTEAFTNLSQVLKYFHIASLGFITLSTILLIAPVAYDRLIEEDEVTKSFLRFSSKMVLFAMIFLGLGLSLEMYVIINKAFDLQLLAIIAAIITLSLSYLLWFGYTFYSRRK